MAFDGGSGKMKNQNEVKEEKKGLKAQPAAEQLVWVVVTTNPGMELRAKEHLENQGFEVYVPMRLFENRKQVLQALPFFPRYIFVRVPAEIERWKKIFSTYYVTGVVGCTAASAVGIQDKVVERIKAQEEGGFIKIGLRQAGGPHFLAGERVRVGTDWGIEATFIEPVDGRRAAILVSLLGRDSRCVVQFAKLKPVP